MRCRIFKDKCLTPDAGLLCKLGSIAVHVDEAMSKDGHPFDIEALRSLLNDPDVRLWLMQMDGLALLPKKRG